MIIAILQPAGVVEIHDASLSGGPVPDNWVVPCPGQFVGTDPEFLTHDGHTISLRSQEEIDAIVAARRAAWQAAKPALVKQVDNAYIGFLTGAWTTLCRAKGYVAPDFTITVENTPRASNIGYLLALMTSGDIANFTTYSNLFKCFDDTLKEAGYSTGDAVIHT